MMKETLTDKYPELNKIIGTLENNIGYVFKNKELPIKALTHTSFANENKSFALESNERIEFLGDSVLGLVVSEYLYGIVPKLDEGTMTKIRARLVCEKSLSKWARIINADKSIFFGKGALNSKAAERDSVLCDAFEAIIAVIYLDGGYTEAKSFIENTILKDMNSGDKDEIKDYKTLLQELLQQKKGVNIEYKIIDEKGPDHLKSFTSIVMNNGRPIGRGTGQSKKDAQQEAARDALSELSSKHNP